MLPMLLSEVVSVSDAVMGVNYGTEKSASRAPCPSGSRVRLHAKLVRAERRGPSVVWNVGVRSRSRARRSPRSSARSSTWPRERPMPEAVIVSAARTPIGRAGKGSLVDARPDDLVAFAIDAALKQVPELTARGDRRRHGRLRLPAGSAGDEPRAPRGAARRPARDGSRHDGEPLLRIEPADDPHGVPRDSRRRGRRRSSPPASSRSRR